jgi:single-stranded-DNA-specific exonuclease
MEEGTAAGRGTFTVRPPELAASRELGRACGVSPAIAQVLLHRGVRDPEAARDFLDPKLHGLTPPDAMADRTAAADRIASAIRRGERIVVFGDYDVDGTTSATITSGILAALGANVCALVANRFEGGYGFSEPALARALEAGAGLIITCDCGSSDHARISAAKARGVDVIVVDHHLVPAEALPAFAFLNPHRDACGFPYKGLCSAGLALSLGAAVRAALGVKLDMRGWLDLVALGTVADVAPLDGDNRRLVRAGLARIASSHARPGVVALREAARIKDGVPISGMDVAFRLAPRLNAAGRLGDPQITLRLLSAATLGEARILAARIEQINQERRAIERRITEEAIAQVLAVYGPKVDGGVVVAADAWHRGVVGIVAARLVDRFGAPAIVIATEDGVGHGSARTPEGFSIYDAIAACRDCLTKFGGHAAAAGMSLSTAKLETFRARFDAVCRETRAALPPFDTKPRIDVVIGDGYELPSSADLALLEPVGEGNEEPLFLLEGASVDDIGVVGEGHLKLALRAGNRRLTAFGWELGEHADTLGKQVTLFGSLRPDTWRGGDAIEMRIAGFA